MELVIQNINNTEDIMIKDYDRDTGCPLISYMLHMYIASFYIIICMNLLTFSSLLLRCSGIIHSKDGSSHVFS